MFILRWYERPPSNLKLWLLAAWRPTVSLGREAGDQTGHDRFNPPLFGAAPLDLDVLADAAAAALALPDLRGRRMLDPSTE
jgi:hypothetical protein